MIAVFLTNLDISKKLNSILICQWGIHFYQNNIGIVCVESRLLLFYLVVCCICTMRCNSIHFKSSAKLHQIKARDQHLAVVVSTGSSPHFSKFEFYGVWKLLSFWGFFSRSINQWVWYQIMITKISVTNSDHFFA